MHFPLEIRVPPEKTKLLAMNLTKHCVTWGNAIHLKTYRHIEN